MADSILVTNVNKNYLAIEKKYDIQLEELKKVKSESRTRGAILLAALLALMALGVTFLAWRYRSRLKQKETEPRCVAGKPGADENDHQHPGTGTEGSAGRVAR